MRLISVFGATVVACAITSATLVAQPTPPATIKVESPTIKAGQPIPVDHTADGKNISPALTWSNLPAGTRQLAIINEDTKAPTPQPFVHWVVYKIPATAKGLPEGLPMDAMLTAPPELAGAIQGISGFRRAGYRGPAPPKPGVTHEYHFIVYALDAELDLKEGMNKEALLEAMKGHILGWGELVATYERKPPQ